MFARQSSSSRPPHLIFHSYRSSSPPRCRYVNLFRCAKRAIKCDCRVARPGNARTSQRGMALHWHPGQRAGRPCPNGCSCRAVGTYAVRTPSPSSGGGSRYRWMLLPSFFWGSSAAAGYCSTKRVCRLQLEAVDILTIRLPSCGVAEQHRSAIGVNSATRASAWVACGEALPVLLGEQELDVACCSAVDWSFQGKATRFEMQEKLRFEDDVTAPEGSRAVEGPRPHLSGQSSLGSRVSGLFQPLRGLDLLAEALIPTLRTSPFQLEGSFKCLHGGPSVPWLWFVAFPAQTVAFHYSIAFRVPN